MRDRPAGAARRWPGPGALAVIAAVALAAILAVSGFSDWGPRLAQQEQLVQWMRHGGVHGPLICVGVQFVQVVIFAIPGEITQFAAGYVFGAALGFLYSITGILAGSAFNFAFAKAVGRPVVERILGLEKLDRFDRELRSRRGSTAVFVLFLLPGAPKDAMAYAAGLSALGIGRFLLLSVPARMPALLGSTIIGSQVHSRDYVTAIWLVVGTGLAVAATAYYRWKRGHR